MMDWLAKEWEETGCTAIIVQNEVAAIGVVQTLQATGIKVPEEVSVITFDGTEVCDLITPHISAVAIPLEQIGIKAVEVLTNQIQNDRYQPQTLTLPLHLRLGDSVKDLASGHWARGSLALGRQPGVDGNC
jgi:DNA-binding LacI/PurR family transcriptional regulator